MRNLFQMSCLPYLCDLKQNVVAYAAEVTAETWKKVLRHGKKSPWCSGQGVGPERWRERGQPERAFESIRRLLLNGRHCTTQSGPLSCNPVAWAHHVVIKNYFGSNTRRGMCLPVDFPLSSRRSKQIMLRRSKCSMGRAIKWCRFVGTYPVRYTE